MLKRFLKEEDGQTVVEYALLIALISLVVIGALTVLGRRASESFDAAGGAMGGPVEPAPTPTPEPSPAE